MNRRNFIKSAALVGLGLGFESFIGKGKTHVLTLSFDDGFKKSFYKAASVHEEYGLKACLNVIAMGHEPGYVTDKYIVQFPLGNFDDWNKLRSRGHEVMPHTWDHKNLTEMPLAEANENMDKCFDYFEKHLEGYKAGEAIYNFAYNASNEALHSHALTRVHAIRTGGNVVLKDTMTNMLPADGKPVELGCWAHGPALGDDAVDKDINEFLESAGGWLMINLHGLDNEGWGPVSTSYLDKLLKRLVKIDYLAVAPAGEVLKMKS